jgi:hypothetical protein
MENISMTLTENQQINYVNTEMKDDVIIQPNDVVFPDSNWDNSLIDLGDIEQKLVEDIYGIKPILVMKKTTYTQAHRKAQQKYREKFPEKYCEVQRKLYDDKKKDEEWKKRFNERSKINNKKYRDRKNKQLLESGIELKRRGRPRKNIPEPVEVPIQNIELEVSEPNNFCMRCENFVIETLDCGYCKKCSEAVLKECEEEHKEDEKEIKKRGRKKKSVEAVNDILYSC